VEGMSDIEPIELGSFRVAVYGAMFGGTVAGQFLGIALDAAVLGRRVLWVPVALSVVFEAIVGARYGASSVGHPLTSTERGRLSFYYSVCLAGLSIPLAVWTAVSRAPGARLDGSAAGIAVATAVAVLAMLTVVRWGLMGLFGRRAA
jgi:hypothetical protein